MSPWSSPKAKVGNLGGFQALFRMRDPRFWLRKPQQSQGFRDVLQPCLLLFTFAYIGVEPCLVSIETRAYNPYQTV